MTELVRSLTAEDADRARVWEPRADVVVEREEAPGRFRAETGPFRHYERAVEREPGGDVREVIRFRLAPLVWAVPFLPLYRSALARRPRRGRMPFWAPPEAPDAAAATAIGGLCILAVVLGYLGTLLTQTITFAADELGASTAEQGATLAAVRVGVLGAVALATLADRQGRRRVLLAATAAACVVSALGALAPGFVALGATQAVVRGLTTAATVLLTIVAAEEMPAGARAYAISLLSMTGALGVGVCLWVLPLADLDEQAWRALFGLALLGLPFVAWVSRHLPESRRFARHHGEVSMGGHGRRFWLLAASALLLSLFTAPASQLMNEFLREERGFSAARISLFTILTNTPGGIGILVGARLADTRGRRLVGAVGIAGGVLLTVAMVLVGGWPMWAFSVLGAVIGAATVPALGVYGPELFPTALRGRANGIIAVLGVTGSAAGLVAAGQLADRWGGLGPALALLSLGPIVMALIVLLAYPETVQRELEDLNPEDRSVAAPAGDAVG